MAAANTDGFRWLPSYYEAIRDLPDTERLAMYDAIADYGFGNPVAKLPPLLQGYFSLIKPSLEKSIRFEQKQRENGGKGGRPKKPSKSQNKPKTDLGFESGKANENLAVAVDSAVAVENAVDNRAARPPRAPRFTPPSVDEVSVYCLERGNGVDAQAFCDFYASKGWKVGNAPMKDWKAAIRTWERREREKNTDRTGNVFLDLAREEGLT